MHSCIHQCNDKITKKALAAARPEMELLREVASLLAEVCLSVFGGGGGGMIGGGEGQSSGRSSGNHHGSSSSSSSSSKQRQQSVGGAAVITALVLPHVERFFAMFTHL